MQELPGMVNRILEVPWKLEFPQIVIKKGIVSYNNPFTGKIKYCFQYSFLLKILTVKG